jgi:hypothetical protein
MKQKVKLNIDKDGKTKIVLIEQAEVENINVLEDGVDDFTIKMIESIEKQNSGLELKIKENIINTIHSILDKKGEVIIKLPVYISEHDLTSEKIIPERNACLHSIDSYYCINFSIDGSVRSFLMVAMKLDVLKKVLNNIKQNLKY